MATSTTPAICRASATPSTSVSVPASRATRKRIEADRAAAGRSGTGRPAAAATTWKIMSMPIASCTARGIIPPASRGLTSTTHGFSPAANRSSTCAPPQPRPRARTAATAVSPIVLASAAASGAGKS